MSKDWIRHYVGPPPTFTEGPRNLNDSSFEDRIASFLQKHDFVSFEWDEDEATLLTSSGEPYSSREFIRGCSTRIELEDIEEDLYALGIPAFKYPKEQK